MINVVPCHWYKLLLPFTRLFQYLRNILVHVKREDDMHI